jgi:hypothetical protein
MRELGAKKKKVEGQKTWPKGTNCDTDCLATNTEYCDRCTHTTTQATNVARIKTERNQGLTRGIRSPG